MSLIESESKVKVGSRDFVIRFRNNENSHKIESIWVATASEAAKPLLDDGEKKSTLMVMFKEGYVAESNDIEFELYVRHSQAYKVRSKRSKLAFGDEHLLTIGPKIDPRGAKSRPDIHGRGRKIAPAGKLIREDQIGVCGGIRDRLR